MSRLLKFRAWDSGRKEFNHLELTPGGYVHMGMWGNVREEHGEWQQYTGLHDSNGTEVYEGDAVEATFGHSSIPIVNPVWYDYEAGTFKLAGHPIADWHNLEIVGNIYENPELLEAAA